MKIIKNLVCHYHYLEIDQMTLKQLYKRSFIMAAKIIGKI